jgi:hypothetical protein
MIASIFFTAPKLELAYQMASNPIQMIEPERVHSITPQSESKVLALIGLRLIIIWVVNITRNSVFMATLVACFLEHFLFGRPGSLVPFSDCARKLLKSGDSCIGISLGADCDYARPNGLSGGDRHSIDEIAAVR